MPIPTRTKSVSVRSTSNLPGCKPPTRQATKEIVSKIALGGTQSTVDAAAPVLNPRQVRDSQVRTASQIRPPGIHTPNASTVSLPTSNTNATIREPQLSSISGDRNSGHIRQRNEAAAISNQASGTGIRSRPTVQSQRADSKTSSVRPLRTRQPAIATTRPVRPQSTTSAASESSISLTSTKTSEVSILQSQLRDELLQLGATHLNSRKVLDAYEQHAEKNLATRTNKVVNQETDLLQLERQKQRAISSRELKSWLDRHQGFTYVQQIQNLSQTVYRLNSHELELKHAQNLQVFQQWLARVLEVHETRTNLIKHNEIQFIAALGHQWHRQASEVEQDLRVIITVLKDAEPASNAEPDNSGIAVLLAHNMKLAMTLLQEVQTAVMVEKNVMSAESEWEREAMNKAQDQLSPTPMGTDVELWAS